MKRRVAALLPLLILVLASASRGDDPVWKAHDDRPIAEPAADHSGDHVVRDGIWAMTVYQVRRTLDPHGRREAANVNAVDEVPDSTWFTNRHARHRLSAAELAAIAHREHPPAEEGPLVVVATKPRGMTPGFVMRDGKGDRYVVKLDPPRFPDVPTGAEMVCTSIVYALGWNVPENHLIRFDPARLVVADGGGRDAASGKPAPSAADIADLVAHAGRLPDGRVRAMASLLIPGIPKGGFRTLGRRDDDPNDTVPHQDRRELRGLRVVAAWLNYTDARRGNFFDTFVPDAGPDRAGHIVHYLLDFSSALGAGNEDWKPRRYGHEYFFAPLALSRLITFGLVAPSWARVPLAHAALGYFDATTFDPETWRTTYPNPLFDAATVRDAFWGAKLVTSLADDDVRVLTQAGEWTDPRASEVLTDILGERRRKIARAYFDWRRIDPIDGFAVNGDRLRFRDLAVENDVAEAALVQHRFRTAESAWRPVRDLAVPLAPDWSTTTVELETSHDDGAHWSPPTRVTLERDANGNTTLTAIARSTD